MIPIILLLSSLYLEPGQDWTPNWSDGHNRTIFPLETDPFEEPTHVEFSGDGSAYINGHGVMSLTGNNPRYRVLEHFNNTEVTLYMKRVNETKELDYAGLVVGVKSHHYTDAVCGADTYYGQINLDGTVKFEKERFHSLGRDAFYPNVKNANDNVYAFPDGIPKDKWIGMKFVVSNILLNSAVRMELYLDRNDSGHWDKILSFVDKGDWPTNPQVKNIDKKCDGYYPKAKVITEPGFVFIRNDGLGRADYKGFTIRELPG